jgi:hypothetical protein
LLISPFAIEVNGTLALARSKDTASSQFIYRTLNGMTRDTGCASRTRDFASIEST